VLIVIHLEEINPDNWRLGLHVKDSQKDYVSDEMRLLARAYAFRNSRSRAVIIYDGDDAVGMALYYDCDDLKAYEFSQFFIDERYQGKGYGMEATEYILNEMRRDAKYPKVVLCVIDGNEAAFSLYQKCGFHLTGERDGNEIIMERKL
jgi:diamine N-acetyltransferase